MSPEYPSEIVPNSFYRRGIDIPLLMGFYPSLFFARRIDGEKKDLVIKVGGHPVLLNEAYRGVHVDDLSVNVVGGRFVARKHIRFRPLDKRMTEQWTGGHVRVLPDWEYEEKKQCFPVYYSARQFYGFPVKQQMTFQREKEFEGFVNKLPSNKRESEYLKNFTAGEPLILPIKKSIDHRPIICNYWHMTFNVFSFEDDVNPICSRGASKPQERILTHLKSDFYTKQFYLHVIPFPIFACFFRGGRFFDFSLRCVGVLAAFLASFHKSISD